MSQLFQSVSVYVNGVLYSLSDGAPFLWLGEDGLEDAPVRRFSNRGAQQHGKTDRGYLLEPRTVSAVVAIDSQGGRSLQADRNTLITYFAPFNNPELHLILKDGSIRRIGVHIVPRMSMPSSERIGPVQKVGLQLEAPDPSLYDPSAKSVDFGLGGGADTFDIPTPVPTKMGASVLDESAAVSYPGTWYTYPVIRITGPITNPVITNVTLGLKLDFTGTTITAGKYYEIDTRYGTKTVVDDTGANKIADLTNDSDLAEFTIAPAGPYAPGGTNAITATGTSITASTQVNILYYVRYRGI